MSDTGSLRSHSTTHLNHQAGPLSLASLGGQLTVEEAVRHLQDLYQENQLLKETLEENNKVLQEKYEEWARQKHEHKEELAQRQEQARKVVVHLRQALKERDTKIEQLQQASNQTARPESNVALQVELQSLREIRSKFEQENKDQKKKIAALELQVREYQKEGENSIAKVTDLKDQRKKLQSELSSQSRELSQLQSEIENNKGAMRKLQQINEHLLAEKRDLLAINTHLSSQVRTHHEPGTPPDYVLVEAPEVETLTGEGAGRGEAMEGNKHKLVPEERYKSQDVQSLQAQVLSLVKELQEADQAAKANIDKYKKRCGDLEAKLEHTKAESQHQRNKDDQLIEALHSAIANLEKQLSGEKTEYGRLQTKHGELRKNFDQLCGDYHELLNQYEEFKSKQSNSELSFKDQRAFQERIDEMTAQVMVAEEALANRDGELRKMLAEEKRMKEEMKKLQEAASSVDIYKTQAEVFRTDFEAERAAREQLAQERTQLQEEIAALNLRIQQLEDEYQTVAEHQFSALQRRHAPHGSPAPYAGTSAEANANLRHAMRHGCGVPRHGPRDTIDGRDRQETDLHQQIEDRRNGTAQPIARETEELHCPKCQMDFPDVDSLQIHVEECLNDDTSFA